MPRPGRRHRPRHRDSSRLPLAVTALLTLALAMAACAPNPAQPEADGDWVLISGQAPDGPIEIVDGAEPTLTVHGVEVSGHTGCNHFGTPEEQAESDTWPTDFVSTMMACDPPEVMAQETLFLDAMSQITDVHASDDELVLTGPDTELRFEPLSR